MTQRRTNHRNRIVEQHLQLVTPIARHYASRTREDVDDLTQVGRLGLIRASRQFSAQRSTPFNAFARPHIRGAILHYLRDSSGIIRLPRGVEEKGQRLTRCNSNDLSPKDRQILMLYRSKGRWSSLEEDHWVGETQDIQAIEQGGHQRELMLALNKLPKEESVAIKAVILEGKSLRQAGRKFSVSAMTVQRRVKRGLTKLARTADELQPML